MTETTDAVPVAAENPAAERLPTWSWLWLPLAFALFLLLFSHISLSSYEAWIATEQSLLEFLHVAVPLASFALALRILAMPEMRGRALLRLWIGLAALGSLFIAGEEASWGQHYLQWATPESWQAINDQGETNLHNTSSWLDQKPRSLLELGIVVGGLLIPVAALRWPAIRRSRVAVILPPMVCLPSAAVAEFARMVERGISFTGGSGYFFYRASEIQEFYFYLFILLYLIVFRRRLRALGHAVAGAR